MTEFPDNLLVNIPSRVFLSGGCEVAVRISREDDIASVRAAYGERLHHVVVREEELGDVAWLRGLSGLRILIVVTDCGSLSSDLVEALPAMRPQFRLDTTDSLLRNINLIASLRYSIQLDAFGLGLAGRLLDKALAYYLYNPLLNTPIEPFHSAMARFVSQEPVTLWSTYREVVGRNMYVGDAEEVSLGERWVSAGICFGTLDDDWGTLCNSEPYRRLVEYPAAAMSSETACGACPHLDVCAGYLRAVNPNWPCEGWQKAFACLREKGRQVVKLAETLSER